MKTKKSEKIMKFYWELSDEIFEGKNYIYDDKSIIFEPRLDIGNFGLYLFDWSIEIPTGTIGKNIFRYLGGYFFEKQAEKRKLIIPESKKGIIKLESINELGDGVYYSDFYDFSKKTYYDKETGWFLVGDINAKGNAIEFASNNIAIISSNNDLLAIYAKLFKK